MNTPSTTSPQHTVDFRALIGVDLGATNVRIGRIEHGDLVDVAAESLKADGSVDEILHQMYRLIDQVKTPDVSSIGVGVPSVVDVDAGIVYDVQNIPSWGEVPLKARLEEEYDLSVFVNNDANCFALGEKHFGKGQGHDSLIGLIVGTGFAGGVIIDGKLYAGPNCGAGEFGMLPYQGGIFEHFCAGLFFEREYGTSGAQLYDRAVQGDQEACAIFDAFGYHLGEAVKAVLYTYDPELIIMGGSVATAFPFFQEAMWERLHTFAYARSVERLQIVVSEREHIALLGAAALALDAA